jgi:hypothetical protein
MENIRFAIELNLHVYDAVKFPYFNFSEFGANPLPKYVG